MKNRPALVFIGSSTEALPIAKRIKTIIEANDDKAIVWQDAFLPGQMLLPNLVGLVETYDFGVFVFSPDDVVTSREKSEGAVRDNVLFEVGIFMGGLGVERSFIVEVQKNIKSKAHIPTDLQGLITARVKESYSEQEFSGEIGALISAIQHHGPKYRSVHDEIRTLQAEIEVREFIAGKRVYLLGDFVRELAQSNPRRWTVFTLAEPLFEQLNKKHGKEIIDDVYWWLVVLGLASF